MRGDARLLVVGPAALARAVAAALPRCQVTAVETLLAGLWTAGQRDVDAVLIALSAGSGLLRAIAGLRSAAPQLRIVVVCPPAAEPEARHAVQSGADDYVLEPVQPEDLAAALGLARPMRPAASESRLPPVPEIVELSVVLQHLGEGVPETLSRLAALLRNAFGAEQASIQAGEHQALAGPQGPAVLQEPLRLGSDAVGAVALGPRATAYTPADAARLADYARLIETIVAQAREQAEWRELAWRDDLTGLRNRRYFDAAMEQLVARAAAERMRVTVVLFDIDDFKTYNDQYGHETGDALLREVGVLLRRCSRERDIVARYGGDELAVIFWDSEQPRVPGSQHPTDPIAVAERFQSVIRSHQFRCLGPAAPGPVTLSGGLACFPWDGQTPAEVVRAADAALLKAKREGKNRVQLSPNSAAPHDEAAPHAA